MRYRHNKVRTKDLDLEKQNTACEPIAFAVLHKVLRLYLDISFVKREKKKIKGVLERTFSQVENLDK